MVNIKFERPCPVTGETCIALSLEAQHPGKEYLEDDSELSTGSRTFRDNSMNADIARLESARYPEACLTLQTEKQCGALASKAQTIWMPFGERATDLVTGSQE